MTTFKAIYLSGCTLLMLTGSVFTQASANSTFAKSAPMAPISSASTAKAPNYLGASISKATTDGFCSGVADCENANPSWKAFAGVRANDNIVLESSYVDFGQQSGTDANGTVSQQATAFTAAALASIPVSDQIGVFGKAGMARWTLEHTNSTGTTKSTGTDMMIGAGADYDFGDNMGLRAEWERYKDIGSSEGQSGDIDLLSLGFLFSSL